ncbi:Ricin B-like lectin [Ceratobasidium theobromae]|uniref:Ricin B-like lectin n=1 Tax=Ceratobasidium theobromae TaxID=1582974 RepID=A0A5N5Q9K2_9AGAM|nr:Ricin B-like lectin [Ceratobasidium theobromae]
MAQALQVRRTYEIENLGPNKLWAGVARRDFQPGNTVVAIPVESSDKIQVIVNDAGGNYTFEVMGTPLFLGRKVQDGRHFVSLELQPAEWAVERIGEPERYRISVPGQDLFWSLPEAFDPSVEIELLGRHEGPSQEWRFQGLLLT